MILYQGIIDNALAGKASPRQAIKAKCLDCCCYDRDEVRYCTVVACPLHAYRPYQLKATQVRPPEDPAITSTT